MLNRPNHKALTFLSEVIFVTMQMKADFAVAVI